jgi:hypothetical protein
MLIRHLLIGIGLLGLAVPVSAHRQSISFAWVSDPAAATSVPNATYSHNDVEGSIEVRRLAVGLHEVRFAGLASETDPFGHVQVTAYGASTDVCQVQSWMDDTVTVACFDSAASPTDAPFTVLFIKDEDHTAEIAYVWANDEDNPGYIPNPIYSFNPTGGATSITRSGTGVYNVVFTGLGPLGENAGHVQVSAYGSAPARCKLESWGADNAQVRCLNLAGSATDSRFTLLFIKQEAEREDIAYGWLDDGTITNRILSGTYSTSPGGSIFSERIATGDYELEFTHLDGFGVNLGTVQVTAHGMDDAWCKVAFWSGQDANVRCFDAAGMAADAEFTIFFHKTARTPFNQEYAFGLAHAETSASYPGLDTTSYNASGGGVSFSRSGVGTYRASWPGMPGVGSDGGAVLVSQFGDDPGYCKTAGWTDGEADVRCFDGSGSPADREYNALFWKPTEGAVGVAYAWANLPSRASYAPLASYSHNPTGAGILISRNGVGDYEVTWTGYGATVQYLGDFTGHAQVTAYGSSNHRCNTGAMHIDGETRSSSRST